MTEKRIRVTISPLGNPKIDAIGFSGQGCKDATKAIEEALAAGVGSVESVMKPEWAETEDEVNIQETHTGW